MRPLADGLEQLGGFPPNAVNIYLMGGVLVDAGTRYDRRRILRQLRGREVSAHALTHPHPDHQGSSHAVCQALGIPLWCGEDGVEAAEDPGVMLARLPKNPVTGLIAPLFGGPGHKVARALREGDEVGGFRVIDTPGHCAGHVSFWRESDRVLVLGDVLANVDMLTGLTRLREPPLIFSTDPVLNRESARKVVALEPELVVFGHGPPLRNPKKFRDFIGGLKA